MTMTATHVSHASAGSEFLLHAFEGWKPFGYQMGSVTVPIESGRSREKPLVVLVPTDALAGAKGFERFIFVYPHRGRHHPCGWQEYRTVFVCHYHGLLRRQFIRRAG